MNMTIENKALEEVLHATSLFKQSSFFLGKNIFKYKSSGDNEFLKIPYIFLSQPGPPKKTHPGNDEG